jgi:hypothetical protein
MALIVRRNLGMLLLAIFLILYGVAALMPLGLPGPILAALALIAGVMILMGR